MLNGTTVGGAIANLPYIIRTLISVVVIVAITRIAVRVATYIITKFFERK